MVTGVIGDQPMAFSARMLNEMISLGLSSKMTWLDPWPLTNVVVVAPEMFEAMVISYWRSGRPVARGAAEHGLGQPLGERARWEVWMDDADWEDRNRRTHAAKPTRRGYYLASCANN